jgi:hypothetical protein
VKRKDRDEDIRERRENYQRGLIALTKALDGFRELTGVDLLDAVDTSGRRMGEAPYLKITAERLAEVTRKIEGDMWPTVADLLPVEVPNKGPVVVPFERKSVVSSYRPGSVQS